MCFCDAEGHTPGESARAIAESQLPGAPANSQSRPQGIHHGRATKQTVASFLPNGESVDPLDASTVRPPAGKRRSPHRGRDADLRQGL